MFLAFYSLCMAACFAESLDVLLTAGLCVSYLRPSYSSYQKKGMSYGTPLENHGDVEPPVFPLFSESVLVIINGHDWGSDLLEVPTIYKVYFSGLCKGIPIDDHVGCFFPTSAENGQDSASKFSHAFAQQAAGSLHPYIIHFDKIFHYKPTIFWGATIYGNPHMGLYYPIYWGWSLHYGKSYLLLANQWTNQWKKTP